MEESSTRFEKFLTKHFPLTEDNVYGAIPLIGLAVSFYSSAMFINALEYELHSFAWVAVWINPALLIFSLVQALWGFRAAQIKCLKLWLGAKGVEAVSSVSMTFVAWTGLLGHGSYYWDTVKFPATINLVVVLLLIYVGLVKHRYLKRIEKKNLEVDCEQPLQGAK